MRDIIIQEFLADYMSDLSEEAYCASWLGNLEYALWDIVRGGSRDFGRTEFAEHQIDRLKELSAACNGWIVWDEKNGPKHVPMNEWLQMYADHTRELEFSRIGNKEWEKLQGDLRVKIRNAVH